MERSRARHRVVMGSLGAALALSGGMVGLVMAGTGEGKTPDLYPLLPTNHSNVNDRWIDTFEQPGKVLYRFDTVIMNRAGAGALDVFRTADGADMTQAFWYAGVPPSATSPSGAWVDKGTPLPTESTPGVEFAPIPGYQITYSDLVGHDHFHAPFIARYSIETSTGQTVSEAAKNTAGFCLYDSWTRSTDPIIYGPDTCRPNEATYTGHVRMGIGPGVGDFYASQLGDQWVDVTAATPGPHRLRAEVDPMELYGELPGDAEDGGDRGNNETTAEVVIPGALVKEVPTRTVEAGQAATWQLGGTVVGAGVRSRRNGACDISQATCMETADPAQLTFRLVDGPGEGVGQVVVEPGGHTVFTPAEDFSGTAAFTVGARDSRGLGGPTRSVTVNVNAPQPVTVTVSPANATLQTGASQAFQAQITGADDHDLVWSVNGTNGGDAVVGTISAEGLYIAPATLPATASVIIRATHAPSGASATATVDLTAPDPDPEVALSLVPSSFELEAGAAKQLALASANADGPLRWTVDNVEGGNGEVGTITNDGLYTAPARQRAEVVTIRVEHIASGVSAQAIATITAPVDPGPTDPGPTDPGPTDPGPTDPGPTYRGPTDPAPTDPGPTDPAPTDPGPTDPAPTDPGPTDRVDALPLAPLPPVGPVDPTPPAAPIPGPRTTPTTPEAAAPIRRAVPLTVRFGVRRVAGRPRVAVVGRTHRALTGRRVLVQRLHGGRAVVLARLPVRANGTFSTANLRTPRAGVLRLRVVLGSTPTTRATRTPAQAIRLAPAATGR